MGLTPYCPGTAEKNVWSQLLQDSSKIRPAIIRLRPAPQPHPDVTRCSGPHSLYRLAVFVGQSTIFQRYVCPILTVQCTAPIKCTLQGADVTLGTSFRVQLYRPVMQPNVTIQCSVVLGSALRSHQRRQLAVSASFVKAEDWLCHQRASVATPRPLRATDSPLWCSSNELSRLRRNECWVLY